MRRGILLLALTGCASLPSDSLEIRMPADAVQGEEVQVYIKARRDARKRIRIELVKNAGSERREVASSDRPLNADETLLLSFTAPERGRFTVRIEAGDLVRELALRVTRRALRVLYVEHPPRYEYRFLKNALIRDSDLLAHCWLTSADEGFPQEHTKSDDPFFQGPLEEFPIDLKSLLEFDVIIYGDVDPARLGPDAARRIASFVTEFGGGLLFIPGILFNPSALRGSPLDDLLPVAIT